MRPMFNFTTDFNRITKQDVSDVNLPPLRESTEKVCFIYIIFHGVSRGYETVYRSRLEACSFFRRAIGLRGKPIVMISVLEQLSLHGSGCHAFRDLAGKSTRKPLVRPSTMRQATMTITATAMPLLGKSSSLVCSSSSCPRDWVAPGLGTGRKETPTARPTGREPRPERESRTLYLQLPESAM